MVRDLPIRSIFQIQCHHSRRQKDLLEEYWPLEYPAMFQCIISHMFLESGTIWILEHDDKHSSSRCVIWIVAFLVNVVRTGGTLGNLLMSLVVHNCNDDARSQVIS
jgi:hypothetical protein